MKTLTVTLADLEFEPLGSAATHTSVEVAARYTSPVVLTDGTIIPAVIKAKTLASTGEVAFEVFASDDPLVRPECHGFAIIVEATISSTRGNRRPVTVQRTVKVLEAMSSPVSLGTLDPAEPLPAQWTTVPEVLGDFDERLDALESVEAPSGVDIKVGGTAPSSGWWLDTGQPGPDPTPPSTPAGLSAMASGATTVALSWMVSTDNVAVAGYEYRIGSGSPVDAGAGTSTTVSGLTASTAYAFQVRAYDAAGNRSTWSATANATTLAGPDVTAPIPGTLAASGATTGGFTLTVTGASDAGAGLHATPYRFSTDNGTTWSAWQAAPTFEATGKTVSTSYTCIHQVRDAAGTPNTATGSSIVATTADPTPTVSDDFNRADTSAGTLGTTTTGSKTWTDPATNWRILGNKAAPTAATPTAPARIVDVTPTTDMRVDFTYSFANAANNSYWGAVYACYDPTANDYYRIYFDHSTTTPRITVIPYVAGAATGTVTGGGTHMQYVFAAPLSVDEVVTLSVVFKTEGASRRITLFVNGVQQVSEVETRATRPQGMSVGLMNQLNAVRIDNLAIYTA
ncbi:fibronectin type III domain-containing protein [Janibacter anophelis]|uniref:fibronectin type III domain-containing protein n=1 Tax=Janibacter anophelis TaxID=319054 RepID=UPI000DF009F3|nr:hypothetical protein [Janibacter anophelis]